MHQARYKHTCRVHAPWNNALSLSAPQRAEPRPPQSLATHLTARCYDLFPGKRGNAARLKYPVPRLGRKPSYKVYQYSTFSAVEPPRRWPLDHSNGRCAAPGMAAAERAGRAIPPSAAKSDCTPGRPARGQAPPGALAQKTGLASASAWRAAWGLPPAARGSTTHKNTHSAAMVALRSTAAWVRHGASSAHWLTTSRRPAASAAAMGAGGV